MLKELLGHIVIKPFGQFAVSLCSAAAALSFVATLPLKTNRGHILKGLASYCKAETTFTFHFSIINA